MTQNNHERHNGRQNHNWNAQYNRNAGNWNADLQEDQYDYQGRQFRDTENNYNEGGYPSGRNGAPAPRYNHRDEYVQRNDQEQYNERSSYTDRERNRGNVNDQRYHEEAYGTSRNEPWDNNPADAYHNRMQQPQDVYREQPGAGFRNPAAGSQGQAAYNPYPGSWSGEHRGQVQHNSGMQQGQHSGKGPKGYSRSDDRIKDDINDRLTYDHELDASELDIAVDSGDVTLSGTVAYRADKRRAEDIAEAVSGVKNVENRIRVRQSAQDHNDAYNAGADMQMNKNRKNTMADTDHKAGKTA